MKRGPTRHMFVEDPELADEVQRMQWCARCNLPASNAIHDLPERSTEERDHENRRVGER